MAFLCLAATSCEIPTPPEPIVEDHTVVYGVLRVGSSTAEVLVEQWPAGGGMQFVPGATVSITRLGQTTPLVDAAPDGLCQTTFDGDFVLGRTGCYSATLPQPVAALETYTLDIVLPDGDVVTAQTTTPAPPDFRTTPDTALSFYGSSPDGLPIAIAPTEVVSAPGAVLIEVGVSVVSGAPQPCVAEAVVEPYQIPSLLESHDFLFWGLECVNSWSVVELELHAAAYDANYAAYWRDALEGNAFSSRDRVFGVSGAVGVFGSAATTVAPLVLDCVGSAFDGCL